MIQLEAYQELTGTVIGCAMKVHRTLGKGFPEVIYQRALAAELQPSGLAVEREVTVPVYYANEVVGSRRVDFLIGGQLLVELKAVDTLTEAHRSQVLNYLHAYRLPIALLINFGSGRLEFKRLLNSRPS